MSTSNPESLFEAAGMRNSRAARAAILLGKLGRQHEWIARLVRMAETKVALSGAIHPFAPSPGDEVAEGDILLGGNLWADATIYGPATMFAADSTSGVLVTGSAGGGKTSAVAFILKQMIQVTPVWIFDAHSEYHRFLADEIRSGNLLVFDYKEFKRNILEPLPGEDLYEAIGRMASVWRRTTFIRDGGENLIRTAIRQCYANSGVLDGSRDYPSVYELREVLSKMKYRVALREAEYHSAVMNRIEGILTQLGQTYDCSQGYPLGDLLNRSIIFRVGGMDAMTYSFFADDLLSASLAYRRLEYAA